MKQIKKDTKSPHRFYVYVLFDHLGRPRYVGKGTGNRWMQHERKFDRRNIGKNKILKEIKAVLGEIPKIKVRENLIEAEALALEIALIKAIGLYPDGPLCNLTAGGDGLDSAYAVRREAAKSPELRRAIAIKASMASAARTPEQRRASIIKGWAGRTPEQRSELARKRMAALTPAQKAAMANKVRVAVLKKVTTLSPEERIKRIRNAVAARTTPAVRIEAIIAALQKNPNAAEVSRQLGETHQTVWAYAKKVGIVLKGPGMAALTPEQRSERARRAAATLGHEKRSEIARKRHNALTPEARFKFARAGSLAGNAVRSREERSETARKAMARKTPAQRSAILSKAWVTRRLQETD